MNRSFWWSMCVVLNVAAYAQAEIVCVTATRTAYDQTLDQVVLRIQSIDGTEIPTSATLSVIPLVGLDGSWNFGSGAVNLPGTASTWAYKLLNDFDSQDSDGGVAGAGPIHPQSWVNFSTLSATPTSRFGRVSGNLYRGFVGGVMTTPCAQLFPPYALSSVDFTPGDAGEYSEPGYGFDNTLLAVLYVTHATTLVSGQTIFSGSGTYSVMDSAGPYPTTVQIVPEPSSLVLSAVGVAAALAFVFRRRHVLRG
jgi:hypothetical protein